MASFCPEPKVSFCYFFFRKEKVKLHFEFAIKSHTIFAP